MLEGVTQRIQILSVDGEMLLEFRDFANVTDRLEVLRIASAGLEKTDSIYPLREST